MKINRHSLNGRSCVPGSREKGFTLLEMLIALAVIALLAMAAQPILNVGLQQLRHLSQASSARENALPEALQWLENDVLQMRGDLPWRWEGTQDEHSCLVRWRFETENFPLVQGAGLVHRSVQYRVDGGELVREVLRNDRVDASQRLLAGVTCLYPGFRQRSSWRRVPRPGIAVNALKISLSWQGPDVVRIWPVNLIYEP